MGRKPSITEQQKEQVLADVAAGELSKAKIADKYGISRQKVYDIIKAP
jgi:predicted DNA-binding protein YlxM (UPF0122 family)